jgi:LacI family transcriptional regulator
MAKSSGKITIHDIAYELGLNASTVSRALANNPVVSQKTRDRVRAKASAMNYRPNAMAAALRRGRSNIIGVIVPAIDYTFFARVIRGMEDEADELGYRVIVCQSYNRSERERDMVETLCRLQVDGIVVSIAKDGGDNLNFYRDLIAKEVPLQFFDTVPEGLGAPTVVINDRQGGYEATKHLIGEGYRRIAHLRGPQYLHIYRDRYLGYLDALAEAGLTVAPGYVVDIESHYDGGENIFSQLWELPEPPDAVFSTSDFSAAGCIKAARQHGLRIPQDLAFIGFANEGFTEIITPTLSTVDQQTIRMGQLTARRIIAAVNGEEVERELVLVPEVIARGSSVRG